jgi:hypothetical protein
LHGLINGQLRYILPKLIVNDHTVKNQSLIDVNGQIQMFTPMAKSMTEVRHEQKMTEVKRSEKAYELAYGKVSVYWCNTNNESSLLKNLDKEAIEIIGSQSIEQKEEALKAFSAGEIKRLITKAKMTGMGLNWQHCNHSVFFPTWSYEQDVTIDRVTSDGQTRVIEAIDQKTDKAINLHTKLTSNVNGSFTHVTKQFNKQIIKPSFL